MSCHPGSQSSQEGGQVTDRYQIRDGVEALYNIKAAVSLTPDPEETIGQYGSRQRVALILSIGSTINSALALVMSLVSLLEYQGLSGWAGRWRTQTISLLS